MLELALDAVKRAGVEILKRYKKDIAVSLKEDGSPVSEADRAAHAVIDECLSRSGIPVYSEENPVPYSARRNWNKFWLVDPLDGTKDFIHQTGGFSVLIALIEAGQPVLGVIHSPVTEEYAFAQAGQGCFYRIASGNEKKLILNGPMKKIVVRSCFHDSEKVDEFLKNNGFDQSIKIGSAMKFVALAKGDASLYPRFSGTSEWDIAAGQIVLSEAGGKTLDLKTFEPPKYNKESPRNNFFLAFDARIKISDLNLKGIF